MSTDAKARMVEGAARLLAERGLQETSFSEVIALTGAPRGSIYHHFPEGKAALVAQAVELAGARALALLNSWSGLPAPAVAARFLDMWRQLLVSFDFRIGCSVTAVTVATDSPDLLAKTAEVFRAWTDRLADALVSGGVAASAAPGVAAMLIAGSEGAVVLSRAQLDIGPFDLVAGQLRAHVAAMTVDARAERRDTP